MRGAYNQGGKTMPRVNWDCDLGPEELVGKTVIMLTTRPDEVEFKLSDGRTLVMGHYQDCCESVTIEDVVGDWEDLLDTPILVAEARVDDAQLMQEMVQSHPSYSDDSSETWTFYTFRTIKGTVDVRWLGTSNGYYSESVDWGWMEP
jgi:hypothetical protein